MTDTAAKLTAIALGGALGALARYGLGGVAQRLGGEGFPWGTLAVNLVGCFLFGLIFAWAEGRLVLPPVWRLLIMVGFLGALTTFSTFAFETGMLMRDRQWLLVLVNLAAHNLIGLTALFLGFTAARFLRGGLG